MEKLDYLDKNWVLIYVMKEIGWWEKERSLVDYFLTYETSTEVMGLSKEVVQAAFEYVKLAVREYDANSFDSMAWGEVLESYSIWLTVAQTVREYCIAMGNLGVDKSVNSITLERKVQVHDLGEEAIPVELVPENPFLSTDLSEEEENQEDQEETTKCECCANLSPHFYTSCGACGSPFFSV